MGPPPAHRGVPSTSTGPEAGFPSFVSRTPHPGATGEPHLTGDRPFCLQGAHPGRRSLRSALHHQHRLPPAGVSGSPRQAHRHVPPLPRQGHPHRGPPRSPAPVPPPGSARGSAWGVFAIHIRLPPLRTPAWGSARTRGGPIAPSPRLTLALPRRQRPAAPAFQVHQVPRPGGKGRATVTSAVCSWEADRSSWHWAWYRRVWYPVFPGQQETRLHWPPRARKVSLATVCRVQGHVLLPTVTWDSTPYCWLVPLDHLGHGARCPVQGRSCPPRGGGPASCLQPRRRPAVVSGKVVDHLPAAAPEATENPAGPPNGCTPRSRAILAGLTYRARMAPPKWPGEVRRLGLVVQQQGLHPPGRRRWPYTPPAPSRSRTRPPPP